MAKPKQIDLTAEELEQVIDQYFDYLNSNPVVRGGPSDLLCKIGIDMDTAKSIVAEPPELYIAHARLLKKAATRLRAHIETSPAWCNGNSSKAIFTLKQQLWDGDCYKDKQEIDSKSDATVRVTFGSGKDADRAFD